MKEIQLTQGKVALVDDDDFEWLNQWKWQACKNGFSWYAERTTEILYIKKHYKMHAEIMKKHGLFGMVDHADRDGLNNKKENLRIANKSENAANSKIRTDNTTGFKGVSNRDFTGKYKARINVDGKEIWLGRFDNPVDAAKEYDKAAKKYFGIYANLNFED